MRPRRDTQHAGRLRCPARKSSTNLPTDVKDPKNPSTSLPERFSDSPRKPSSSRRPDGESRRTQHQVCDKRSTSRGPFHEGQQRHVGTPKSPAEPPHSASKTSRNPSTDQRNASELRRTHRHLKGPPSSCGTRQRTVDSPPDSEEPLSERHARLRAPENPAPGLRQTSGLRRDFQQAISKV